MDLLKNLQNLAHADDKSHAAQPTPTPTTTAPAPAQSSTDRLFSKLGDALSGSSSHIASAPTPAPAPAPAPESQKHGAEKLFSMLGDSLGGGKPAAPPAPTPAPKDEGLLGKLSSAIAGKPQQTPPGPAGHASFADKINAAFGGGAKGEAEEDKIDKAIDLFQQHILKEGPQDNESALEQIKDKKIADAIRNAIGQQKK